MPFEAAQLLARRHLPQSHSSVAVKARGEQKLEKLVTRIGGGSPTAREGTAPVGRKRYRMDCARVPVNERSSLPVATSHRVRRSVSAVRPSGENATELADILVKVRSSLPVGISQSLSPRPPDSA